MNSLTGFAWTTAILTVLSYFSYLLTLDWLGQRPEIAALWCLPLVSLEIFGQLFERRGRVRWAIPFHVVALVSLLAALDVIALKGPTLEMIGIDPPFLNRDRQIYFSLAMNGLLFLAILILLARSGSLDLRRAGRLLEIVAPVHLLGALYVNTRKQHAQETVFIDF